ncbi:hypothetical protein NWO25_15520 [Enterococcus lactis]|nr:hypothetical protein [Enterococcus lactis]
MEVENTINTVVEEQIEKVEEKKRKQQKMMFEIIYEDLHVQFLRS